MTHPAYRFLWNLSRRTMHDATNMRTLVYERDHTLALRPARMPEESVTVNIVRNIAAAVKQQPKTNVRAILHTRALESGNNKAQNKSKADLELTIRLGSHGYWNFVLQAKSFRTTSGRYDGWSTSDNQILVNWAKQRGQTPGMLLYNEEVPPFSTLTPNIFGLCKAANHYEPRWYKDALKAQSKPALLSMLTGTPAGISMCVLNSQTIGLDKPKPQDFQQHHFPIEHLLHSSHCTSIGGSPGGPTRPKSGPRGKTKTTPFSLSEEIPLVGTSSLPVWAKALLPSSEEQENTEAGKFNLRQIEDLDPAQQKTIIDDMRESGTAATIFLDLDI